MAPRERLKANGHSVDLTHGALQERIDQNLATSKALLSERQSIALASVAGDTTASARIVAIDRERTALEAGLITLQDARRALHDQERETGWQKWLPHALRVYRGTLIEQHELQAHRLKRYLYAKSPADLRDLAQQVATVEDFAHEEAHRIAKRIIPSAFGRIFTDAGDSQARQSASATTQQQRARAEAQLADALMREAPSFSDELLAVLREANARLQRAGISTTSHVRPSVHGVIGRVG